MPLNAEKSLQDLIKRQEDIRRTVKERAQKQRDKHEANREDDKGAPNRPDRQNRS